MISVYLDPFLFACPAIDEGPEEYNDFISSILNWQELNNCDWVEPFILGTTADILSQINKYPLWDDLKSANNAFGIDYISPDSVMKLITSFLSKFNYIDDKLSIDAIDYRNITFHPEFFLNRHSVQLLNDSFNYFIVLITLKSRVSKCLYNNEILLTRPKGYEKLDASFSLFELLASKNEELAKLIYPSGYKITFDLFSDYQSLESARNIKLIKTEQLPSSKSIKLSGDHHGNSMLFQFAKRLIQSPYVLSIINNLPFNSYTRNFIFKVYENGNIDIYLNNTDEGFGLTVQTTGRNFLETMEISKILHDEFSHKQ